MGAVKAVMLAAGILIVASGGPALGAGDAGKAKSLIVEHCTACHRVPGYARSEGEAELGAPPFRVIAHASGTYTEARLRAFLRQPHWPMTKFVLSETDVDNILAYFESLRAE